MTTMERFLERLREKVPQARLTLDRPERGGGSWWLDAQAGRRALTVQWNPSLGFGVSSLPSEGFGEGPDEFFEDEGEALARVERLLKSGGRTKHSEQMALKRLREACHVSQAQLAKRMKITQGAISKLERSPNPSVGVLRDWVRALGGDVEILAKFDDVSVKVTV